LSFSRDDTDKFIKVLELGLIKLAEH